MHPSYWVLITHATSLPAIFIFLWSYKRRGDYESLFIFIKFVFCVTFSLFYHTYDVSGIPTVADHQETWTLLDGYSSTSLIFSTTLYGLRVRPPYFYHVSYGVETTVLVLHLFENTWFLITWLLVLSCFIVFILKWRTVYRYILRFTCCSLMTVVFGIAASVFFTKAVHSDTEQYIIYHSLWHCAIFGTAACGSLLRYKLDEQLYPVQRRAQLDSI